MGSFISLQCTLLCEYLTYTLNVSVYPPPRHARHGRGPYYLSSSSSSSDNWTEQLQVSCILMMLIITIVRVVLSQYYWIYIFILVLTIGPNGPANSTTYCMHLYLTLQNSEIWLTNTTHFSLKSITATCISLTIYHLLPKIQWYSFLFKQYNPQRCVRAQSYIMYTVCM